MPTRREASDFSGIVPPVFPYLCALCNITVFSEKVSNRHRGKIPTFSCNYIPRVPAKTFTLTQKKQVSFKKAILQSMIESEHFSPRLNNETMLLDTYIALCIYLSFM